LIGGLVGSGASEAMGEGTSDDALSDPEELDPADDVDELDEDPETESSDASEESAGEEDPQAPGDGLEPPADPQAAPPELASTAVTAT